MEIKGVTVRQEDINRLYSKITIREDGCWEVDCYKNDDGYSIIGIGRKTTSVHRLVYLANHQDENIEDVEVCHTCDRPWCCCPDHLFIETHQGNMTDMVVKGRQNKGSLQRSAILNEEDVKDILNKILDGTYTSVIQIANYYGVTRAPISTILYGMYWTHVTKDFDLVKIKNMIVKPNSRCGEAGKLSPDDVRDIRKRLANGELQSHIAKLYKIDNSVVRKIRLNEIHKKII